jgi:transposase
VPGRGGLGIKEFVVAMKAYSKEFKADAVALYLSDPALTYASVGKDLGVNRETLRVWVRQAQAEQMADTPGKVRAAEQQKTVAVPVASDAVLEEENKQLRARIAELELERDILRKAAKYFAGETKW